MAEATHFSKYSGSPERRDCYFSIPADSKRLYGTPFEEEQLSSSLARTEKQMPDAYLQNTAIFQEHSQTRFSDILE
jgi:hypothetical protein